MKRDPALISLSHDHHQALFLAQRLRRANADAVTELVGDAAAYWSAHGEGHFRLEEEVLFPAFAGAGDPYHPLLARALCDHAALRHRFTTLHPGVEPSVLHELGELLATHVHLEERQLFGLIEETIPAGALAALARRLEH